jgi:methylenetetrahydrofolate dehydrogenase (NADP+)/methenyltetrahydrofolate cyclohydrolase
MIVDGKAIAENIYRSIKIELQGGVHPPTLTVFACAPNIETKKFLEIKKRRAAELGIDVAMMEFAADSTTAEVVEVVKVAASRAEGIIVQLPFPSSIDTEQVISSLPARLDVDALHYDGGSDMILPPVVGAIAEIARVHEVSFSGKQVVVLGHGRLVGKPAALWAKAEGAIVTVIDKNTSDASDVLLSADIIISGTGSPSLITPDKIKEGVIIFDAGTSEEGGQLKGDADPACAARAALFTPVPGGIGPITIALLFRNLLVLAGK